MVVRDTRERGVIRYDGHKEIYRVHRMQCCGCRKLHTALPDFMLPFKHYDAQSIQATLDSKPDNCCVADDSTMRRWKRSFGIAQSTIIALLVSYYMKMASSTASLFNLENILPKIRSGQTRWLAFVIRLLINSGHRLHTCFAFCP
jgi:hypothetical protein